LQNRKDHQSLKSGFTTGATGAEDQGVISGNSVFAESALENLHMKEKFLD